LPQPTTRDGVFTLASVKKIRGYKRLPPPAHRLGRYRVEIDVSSLWDIASQGICAVARASRSNRINLIASAAVCSPLPNKPQPKCVHVWVLGPVLEMALPQLVESFVVENVVKEVPKRRHVSVKSFLVHKRSQVVTKETRTISTKESHGANQAAASLSQNVSPAACSFVHIGMVVA